MSIPKFVIAGQPNEGKTTVVATLTEDSKAEISNTPGTTKILKQYTVKIDNESRLCVVDTPGFENPGELLEWFRENVQAHDNPAQAFLDISAHKSLYPYDCEIMKPIAEGAAIIHVINPDRKVMEEDRWESEIFRLCRRPRIGLLNSRNNKKRYLKDWDRLLTQEANTYLEFDAKEAVFADRIKLLEALARVLPNGNAGLEEVISFVSADWNKRIAKSAESIVENLREAVQHRVSFPYVDESKEEVKAQADKAIHEYVRKLEKNFRNHVRKLFRHLDDHWEYDPKLDFDIMSEDAWQLFGFSKSTIICACAVAGAASGTLFDVATGGSTLGIGALTGALIAVTAALLFADRAVEIQFPKIEFPELNFGSFGKLKTKMGGGALGGRSLVARIERRSKLPGIIFDRMTCYSVAVAQWAHGKRRTGDFSKIDESVKISKCLQDSKEADRFLALIELWYRSVDTKLTSSELQKIGESEKWIQGKIIEHIARATMRVAP